MNRSLGDAARIIPVAAPAGETIGVEGPLRRRPEPGFPVQVDARPEVLVDRIGPEIVPVVARVIDLGQHNLAERPLPNILVGGLIGVIRHALHAHLHLHAGTPDLLHKLPGLLGGLRHGLFAVDVLAGRGGVHAHLEMPVFGRRDQHVIDIAIFEQPAVVLRRARARQRSGLLQALLKDVADGDNLDVVGLAQGEERAQVSHAHPSAADRADPQAVIGAANPAVAR